MIKSLLAALVVFLVACQPSPDTDWCDNSHGEKPCFNGGTEYGKRGGRE